MSLGHNKLKSTKIEELTGREIKRARKAVGYTQKSLAEASGIPAGTISRIEATPDDPIKKVEVINALVAVLFPENEEDIVLIEPIDNKSTGQSSDNTIPIYDIEIDAGNIARIIDSNNKIPVVGHIYLKDSENASGLIGVRAKGDSMATFINGGDTMLIRRLESRTFVPPGNAYVIIGRELSVVKYIRNSPDKSKWVLRSHNEFYEDFEVNKEDVVHLFIVVKVLKELTY